ncbi:hypothetical protein K7432_010472 [Basidiobolus ranarum]|uniref:Arrestin C-terminal-like domain-containing protein n=1 Tax=Basidiobolus ranarum TaxID=34480 RepID=A0ABR2VVF3_9FUNG
MIRSLVNYIVSILTANSNDQNENTDKRMLKSLLYAVKPRPRYLAYSVEETIPTHKAIDIKLTNSLLTIYGRPQDSAGVVLRGRMRVNLRKPIQAKSIMMVFKGTFTTYSPIDKSCCEKTIVEHHHCFLRTSAQNPILKADCYQFDFEIPLCGNLPPSVVTGKANIQYQVTGIIERPFLYKNIVTYCPVFIQRAAFPDNLEIDPSTMFSGMWASCVYYDVSTPDLNFVIGESIPLSFKLCVVGKRVQLHYIHVLLEERITYQDEEFLFPTSVNESISCLKICCPDVHGLSWEDTISLPIPTKTHEGCASMFVEISHKLIVRFAINLPDTGMNILFGQIPLKLKSTTQAEASSPLPLYEPQQFPLSSLTFPTASSHPKMNRELPNYDNGPPPKYRPLFVT